MVWRGDKAHRVTTIMKVTSAKVLVMGLTFKENCPDFRNTRVVDVISELKDYNCEVHVTDCWADNA